MSSLASSSAQLSEPPERIQFKAQRIFLSLCLQIVAKFFVNIIIPSSANERPEFNCDDHEMSVNVSCRSDMARNVRSFRTIGGEALLVLSIVRSDFLLTTADRQFALWTLREACVSAFEVDISEGHNLMIWCKLVHVIRSY